MASEKTSLRHVEGQLQYGTVPRDPTDPPHSNAVSSSAAITLWQVLHFIFFFTGGSTFIAGSCFFLYPDWPAAGWWGAVLYIIGSTGFLAVDVQEFFTFTERRILRCNIAMSMTGSALYLIGSYGFLPDVMARSPNIGPWGFIVGSAFIGVSQLWKCFRIGCGGDEFAEGATFRPLSLCGDRHTFTEFGVEISPSLGAWLFFFPTIMFQYGPITQMSFYLLVVHLWIVGSVFFCCGSMFMGYRHFIMRV